MQWLILVGFAIIAFVLWQIWSDRKEGISSGPVVAEQPGDWWGPWFGPWWNSGGKPWQWLGNCNGGYGPNGYGPRGWWPRPKHGPMPVPGPGPAPGTYVLGPGGANNSRNH